jgi:hypothetical protein
MITIMSSGLQHDIKLSYQKKFFTPLRYLVGTTTFASKQKTA